MHLSSVLVVALLLLLALLLCPAATPVWAAVAQIPGCRTDVRHVQSCRGRALPKGVCLWQQGFLRNKHFLTGPSRSACVFEVRHADFMEVIGENPTLEFVTTADAHEGGVYYPDTQDFYFSSTRKEKPYKISLNKLSLITNEVSTVMENTSMSNGMVLDLFGNLVVCQQGLLTQVASIQRINLLNLETSIVADNWFGLPFNSPNDIVVKKDGSLWFTDPDYGWIGGFKTDPPYINNQVYRISPQGVVDAVADGFTKPNGLAFSHDEKLLYVTDTGSLLGNGYIDASLPHSVYVFDVDKEGKSLSNRRLFASISSFEGTYPSVGALDKLNVGAPDGIKVDTQGHVYVANVDGIQVFSKNGDLLGLIHLHGSANMGFVGKMRNQLLILNDTAIHSVRLNAHGAGLFYVEKYSK